MGIGIIRRSDNKKVRVNKIIKQPLSHQVLVPFAILIGGFLSGKLGQMNMYPWYSLLHKSYLTPPAWVFPMAWSMLYLLLGYILIRIRRRQSDVWPQVYFFTQLLFNYAWSQLFFYFHQVNLALMCLSLMILLNIKLLSLLAKNQEAYLLLPYLSWLFFAFYLNSFIALNN